MKCYSLLVIAVLVLAGLACTLMSAVGDENTAPPVITDLPAAPTSHPENPTLPASTMTPPSPPQTDVEVLPPQIMPGTPIPPGGDGGSLIYALHEPIDSPVSFCRVTLWTIPLNISGEPAGLARLWKEWQGYVHDGMYAIPEHSAIVEVDSSEGGTFVGLTAPSTGESWSDGPLNGASKGIFLSWTPTGQGLLHQVRFEAAVPKLNRQFVTLTRRDSTQILIEEPRISIASAALSPDEKTLIYSTYDNSQDGGISGATWRVDLATGVSQKLLDTYVENLTWSPDGQWIAFKLDCHPYLLRPDGTHLLKVADVNVCEPYEPLQWSPAGEALAFVGLPAGKDLEKLRDWDTIAFQFSAYVAEITEVGSGAVHPVVPDHLSGYIDPSWSPDGQWLLVTGPDVGKSDVWLVSRDGQTIRQLTTDGETKRYPVWIP